MPINGQDTRDELIAKQKRLVGEIEHLQQQSFDQNRQLNQMKEIIEEKRHTQQLAGWAIDRALETSKQGELKASADDIIKIAEKFCVWVHASSAPEIKSKDGETMQ